MTLEERNGTVSEPLVSKDDLRGRFARRLSEMYAEEVPLYGTLLATVVDHNREVLLQRPEAGQRIDPAVLSAERHGAIRVAKASEMRQVAALFRVLGMRPVNFYDLTAAPEGKRQPVIATAFRPVDDAGIERAPFRMFTSLLVTGDTRFFPPELGLMIDAFVGERRIMGEAMLDLIGADERQGGLTADQADRFLEEAVRVFAWEPERTVPRRLYDQLMARAPIAADIVLKPHLNHLTPRSLDIEELHHRMSSKAVMKESIEGPPPHRRVLVLLRQTSYRALDEVRAFTTEDGGVQESTHRARFGEIEQRGLALTRAGHRLYEEALDRRHRGVPDEEAFSILPDDLTALRRAGLAYFRYVVTGAAAAGLTELEDLIAHGVIEPQPIVYEDFLPVSAAGIFGSNLAGGVSTFSDERVSYSHASLEAALGRRILDSHALYAATEARSLERCYGSLAIQMPADLAVCVQFALRADPHLP